MGAAGRAVGGDGPDECWEVASILARRACKDNFRGVLGAAAAAAANESRAGIFRSAPGLKGIAIVAVLMACSVGVGIPLLLNRKRGPAAAAAATTTTSHVPIKRFKNITTTNNASWHVLVKSFAAGVMLATGFVHILPDAFESLTHPCLLLGKLDGMPPWPARFPVAGFVAMLAALLTLMAELWGSQLMPNFAPPIISSLNYDSSAITSTRDADADRFCAPINDMDRPIHSTIVPNSSTIVATSISNACCEECVDDNITSGADPGVHHRVIAQVLEFGIVAHSTIIGISLGTSQSICVIKPLLVVLTFHQFFEGLALGGSIVQAQYKSSVATMMGFVFAITSPIGIGVGMAIASSYNESSPTALIVEGIFDALSAGILIYMSLVDLIATDLRSHSLQMDARLQLVSFLFLFFGTGTMSLLANWA